MVQLSPRLPAVVLIVLVCNGCSTDTATQEPSGYRPSAAPGPETRPPAAIAVPETPLDRGIRRELSLSISHDADLKNRDISFIVTNGDISVTGIVRTEEERRKINDLAMSIDGVKSVANAVLIAE